MAGGGDATKICDKQDAPSAESFGIGDTVAATADFRIGGALAVEKGCPGTVICHGERPDGSIGVSIQFEAWRGGRDANVLCKPHEIQVVAKAPSADSFGIGDTVAAASDFRIGGALVVEKGCKGTVICHGQRPEPPAGGIGISIRFWSRKDGSDANVLCWPHEIQAVAKAANAKTRLRDSAASLEQHLRHAWGVVSLALQSRPASPDAIEEVSKKTTIDKSPAPLQKQKVKRRRNVNDRSQDLHEDDGIDRSEETPSDASQQHQRWSMFIIVLVLVNVIVAYVHLQRRSGKQNLHAVGTLTDDSFLDHIVSNPNGTLVTFFSSSGEACAKLAPELEEAAKELQKTSNVPLVSVSANLAPLTFKQYLVRGLPTLSWFSRGRLVREADQSVRSAAQIVDFVKECMQPALIEFGSYAEYLDSMPQLRKVLEKGKTPPIVAGFGPDPAVHDVLEQVGEKFKGDTAFLFVPEARHNDPSIRALFRDSTADKDYNGSLKVDDILKWLQPFMVE